MNSQKLFKGEYAPGLYEIDPTLDTGDFSAAATAQNFAFFKLNGEEIHDQKTFIASFAKAAHFPDYAQSNWDAFEECIRDLHWCQAEGYVLLYQNPQTLINSQPQDWRIASDILFTAVQFWQTTATPMFVFVEK